VDLGVLKFDPWDQQRRQVLCQLSTRGVWGSSEHAWRHRGPAWHRHEAWQGDVWSLDTTLVAKTLVFPSSRVAARAGGPHARCDPHPTTATRQDA
jgi:hypothetical protein